MTTYKIELEASAESHEQLADLLIKAADAVRSKLYPIYSTEFLHFEIDVDHEDFEPPTVGNEVV